MTNILDRVAHPDEFHPETTQHFFALQLARKLNDVRSVRSYARLAEQYSDEMLMDIYRAALQEGLGPDLAQRFRTELRRRIAKEEL